MRNYNGFLFDLDGTLVDTEKLKGAALSEACSFFGSRVDAGTYKPVMGNSWQVVLDHFFQTARINPSVEKFNDKFEEIYQRLLDKSLSLNLNARDFLIRLKSKKKKMGVVSSESTRMVGRILNQLDIIQFFATIITEGDVKRHKPDPEAYILALKKMDLLNSEVLAFEDSQAGLIATNKAGCDAVAFQHEFNVNNDLSLSIRIITDFKEIKV